MELCFHDECPICFEQMRDTHFFVSLDCGHIFCKNCVDRLKNYTIDSGFFLCPYCRRIQYTSKCYLIKCVKNFYHRYKTEIQIFLKVCLWMSIVLIFIIILLLLEIYSAR